MLLTKLKLATTVVLLMVALGAGGTAGVLAYLAGAGEPTETPQTTAAKTEKDKPETPQRKKQHQPQPENKAPAPTKTDEGDRIRPGDFLNIRVGNALRGNPIGSVFQVEASGKVALGPGYGRVNIKGLTLEEAEAKILEHLAKIFKEPGDVLVPRPIPTDPALERRVRELENEVRALRSVVEELRKKGRQ